MQSRRKKAAGMILVLCVFFCWSYAFAEVYTSGDFAYEVIDGGVVLLEYFGDGGEVYVPDQIAGQPVSVIASGAFAGHGITAISLPDTIMEIERGGIVGGIRVSYRLPQEDFASDSRDSESKIGNQLRTEDDEKGMESAVVNSSGSLLYDEKEAELEEDAIAVNKPETGFLIQEKMIPEVKKLIEKWAPTITEMASETVYGLALFVYL